jgi:5-formyltetrahydrofolate cyclo-ligase
MMNLEPHVTKNDLRKMARQKVLSLSKEEQKNCTAKIVNSILHLFNTYPFPSTQQLTLSLFGGSSLEPNLLPDLLPILLKQHWRVCFYQILKDKVMQARQIRGLEDLTLGAYNIYEPVLTCPVVPAQEMNVLLIPGLLFDTNGHRLGRGAGYYDRYLTYCHSSALRIGVTYSTQLNPTPIPCQDHDQKMNYIITDLGVMKIE